MKKLIGIFALCALTSGAFAQDSSMHDTSSMSRMDAMKKDCYLMKDGKMMMRKGGDTAMMMMDSPVKLTNGATVMKDGTIKMADGSTKMLKEGHYVDIDGKMGKVKKMKPVEDRM